MHFKIIVTILALFLGGCVSTVIYSDNPSEVSDFDKARVYIDCRVQNGAARSLFFGFVGDFVTVLHTTESSCLPKIKPIPKPDLYPNGMDARRTCDSYKHPADRDSCRYYRNNR